MSFGFLYTQCINALSNFTRLSFNDAQWVIFSTYFSVNRKWTIEYVIFCARNKKQ